MLLTIEKGKLEELNANYTFRKGDWLFVFKGYFSVEGKMYTGQSACKYIENKIMYEGSVSPENLNGIFLTLMINKKKKLIQVLNDRFGFYQVFYAIDNDTFYLGDHFWEVAAKAKANKIGTEGLMEFLQFRFVSGEKTLAEEVSCIEPASLYTIDFGSEQLSIDRKEYWQFKYEPAQFTQTEAEEAIYSCLSGIINRYKNSLFADKKIGLNLTGGFDSRYLLALLIQQNIPQDRIFTFTYGSSDCEDVEIASQLDENLKVHHHLEIFDTYFRDFFRPGHISEIINEIGFYTYYLQGYGMKKLEERYRSIDFLLTGSDGFFMGLNTSKKLFGAENIGQIIDFIYEVNATMLSDEEVKMVAKNGAGDPSKIVKENLKTRLADFPGDPLSAFYDWTLKNRHRKYLLSIYEMQNRHALHLMPFYDYEFIDLMAKLPVELLEDQKPYINSLYKKAFTGEPAFMREIPFEMRGKLVPSGENFVTKKPLKFTIGKFKEKLLNPPDNKFQYPIQQVLRKFPDLWDTIHNELQISNSKYLDSEKCIALIEKNKRNNIFTRYGLVIILSVIRFEKMLSNNPVREE